MKSTVGTGLISYAYCYKCGDTIEISGSTLDFQSHICGFVVNDSINPTVFLCDKCKKEFLNLRNQFLSKKE